MEMPSFALHAMLKAEHGCREISEQVPEDPSCPDQDQGYTWYISATGQLFMVPPPDNGELYTEGLIKRIMHNAGIGRVVTLRPKTEENKKDEKEAGT